MQVFQCLNLPHTVALLNRPISHNTANHIFKAVFMCTYVCVNYVQTSLCYTVIYRQHCNMHYNKKVQLI
jgi:hypothetical protein